MKSYSDSYKRAGVDVTAGYEGVRLMSGHVRRTHIPGVIGGLGGFGGLFKPDLSGMKAPVLVSGTDGVGTKLKLAFALGRHDTVGIDCVAMCVNDIICSGAKPLFFLDYIALGKNVPETVATIVAGVAEGCVQAGCALIGGETAEMPGFYPAGEYDLAGFAVGVADEERLLDSANAAEGDALIALSSSGVHSNGFSLVRKILSDSDTPLDATFDGLDRPLGEALLAPTKIYVKPVLALLREVPVKSAAHITGGGFYENIPRALPAHLSVKIDRAALRVPHVFALLQRLGGISDRDMFNVFNMGAGMCVIVAERDAERALGVLSREGEEAAVIGRVVAGEREVLFA
ncbi:phosphoribosylformylglycinamidine cyclo-ligase [Treponema endosymbiont of Eucomonympha sp.]|uniref:phosphoribosylformylglycinamidine cyclo-ligase n=1 Tax=Treponema endosymbiont of Eucomonympha sp. TaxID=1580831 RepID=UPI0007858192|nr:phosphoribosylformylglycinamidine cyclo-ligase [Treponema endosymbiont of Eucomonympha sp.]